MSFRCCAGAVRGRVRFDAQVAVVGVVVVRSALPLPLVCNGVTAWPEEGPLDAAGVEAGGISTGLRTRSELARFFLCGLFTWGAGMQSSKRGIAIIGRGSASHLPLATAKNFL